MSYVVYACSDPLAPFTRGLAGGGSSSTAAAAVAPARQPDTAMLGFPAATPPQTGTDFLAT